jgi:hypothetical protein
VSGIDLHPVVVTLARVTYLLAIGRERLEDRGELMILVYLADRNAVRCRTAGEGPRGTRRRAASGKDGDVEAEKRKPWARP